jgi:hypothetical protein
VPTLSEEDDLSLGMRMSFTRATAKVALVNYYQTDGFARLVQALQFRAQELGISARISRSPEETTGKRSRTKISQIIESIERQQENERQSLYARLQVLQENLSVFHRELTGCIRLINTDPYMALLHINDLAEQLAEFRERFPVLHARFPELRDSGIGITMQLAHQVVNGMTRIDDLYLNREARKSFQLIKQINVRCPSGT